jgi:peptidoglycan/xylan/chitin deacetylase (PgdA/CDA1 family)
MVQCGMHVGSHGYDHYWLGSLPKEKQAFEIKQATEFIKNMYGGGVNHYYTMCYPYGDCNADTLSLLKQYEYQLGFTTEVRVASLNDSPLTLPRMDTNDLPKTVE